MNHDPTEPLVPRGETSSVLRAATRYGRLSVLDIAEAAEVPERQLHAVMQGRCEMVPLKLHQLVLDTIHDLRDLDRRRLPASPLLDALERRGIPLAALGHTDRRAVQRARTTGQVALSVVDRIGVEHLGLTPELLYGREAAA